MPLSIGCSNATRSRGTWFFDLPTPLPPALSTSFGPRSKCRENFRWSSIVSCLARKSERSGSESCLPKASLRLVLDTLGAKRLRLAAGRLNRSEERRVGKECRYGLGAYE